MNKTFLYLSFMGMLVLAGCTGSLQVVSDYNGQLDFSEYRTFNLYEPDSVLDYNVIPVLVNPINQRRVESAIREEMEVRGYTLSEEPDILVTYFFRIEDRKQYEATTYYTPSYYGGWGYYGYYGGYGYGWTEVREYDYEVGTLIIELVDRKRNELIWYGAGTKALSERPRHVEDEINNAVTHIFYQYNFMAGRAEQVVTTHDK